MRSYYLPTTWLLLLVWLASYVLSQDLPAVAMVYPPRVKDHHPKIYFQPGENVTFNWTSTYPWITLELYQGPGPDGRWVMVSLLTNVSNVTHQSWNWSARVFPSMNRGIPSHLHLFNAEDPECPRCHSNSSLFEIAQPGSDSSSGSATSSGSEVASSRSKVPLGLGLGLGLPLLVLLVGSAVWMYSRRQKRAREGDRQTTVPLVDSKAAGLVQEDVKAEMQGREVVELSTLENVAEAPTVVERVELEAGDGRGYDNPRREGI